MNRSRSQCATASSLPAESGLLLACASFRERNPDHGPIVELLGQVVDWDEVIRLAELHAFAPLMLKTLAEIPSRGIPARVLAQLKTRCAFGAAHNLWLVRQLCEVLTCLAGAGIVAIPYKGPVLAQILYGDVAMRESSDIDLLVRKHDVPLAHTTLRALGYEPLLKLPEERMRALLRFDYEAPVVRHGDGSLIDLQWASAPRFLSLPGGPDLAGSDFLAVTLGGQQMRTLGFEDLLLMLCSHGAKHVWSRLQWIADVAGIISVAPALDWDGLLERAAAWRRRRMLLLGVSLANGLLGVALPEQIQAAIQNDSAIARLAGVVQRHLFDPAADEISVTARAQFLASAVDHGSDAALYFARLALTPTPGDWEAVRLPAWLAAGYYLVRPIRLLGKYVLRSQRR